MAVKSETALVNTAESPDQMKEKFKNFLRISLFGKILKLTQRAGKSFRLEKKSSGISDLASGFPLAVLTNCRSSPISGLWDLFYKGNEREKY